VRTTRVRLLASVQRAVLATGMTLAVSVLERRLRKALAKRRST
jgi:hypothetical protein